MKYNEENVSIDHHTKTHKMFDDVGNYTLAKMCFTDTRLFVKISKWRFLLSIKALVEYSTTIFLNGKSKLSFFVFQLLLAPVIFRS